MSRPVRVASVEHLGDRSLRVTFTDGLVRELDFQSVLVGALAALDCDSVFSLVEVDRLAGTVSWPSGIDFDPDVLHGDHQPATGVEPRVIREYRLQESGTT